MKISIGLYDSPQEQKQDDVKIDLCRDHIAVIGSSGSGKTTFIKTLLVRLHEEKDCIPEEHIYILDFGGNIGDFGDLGRVCACFGNNNEENVKRLFNIIEKRLSDTKHKLRSRNYRDLYRDAPKECPPHITFIIENVDSFLANESYAYYLEKLMSFSRDGLSLGLTMIITAKDTSGMMRLLTHYGQKIALALPSNMYLDLFGKKVMEPMKNPGRGLMTVDMAIREFQCYWPFPARKYDEQLKALIKETSFFGNPYKLLSFPDNLTKNNAKNYQSDVPKTDDTMVDLGLEYVRYQHVYANLTKHHIMAIYGKRFEERVSILNMLVDGLIQCKKKCHFVILDDGRQEMKALNERITGLGQDTLTVDYSSEKRYMAIQEKYWVKKTGELVNTPDRCLVFIFQSRELASEGCHKFYDECFQSIYANAANWNCYLIFSDMRPLVNHEASMNIHKVQLAFLMDDIADFVRNKGKGTVFSEMDYCELKTKYASCNHGDGYYYDSELDLIHKVKFYTSSEEG